MSEIKKKSLWWWPWQTEKVEAMLESMAAQGWHMTHARRACTRFVFKRGEPRRVRYCIDYQEKEQQDYLRLLRDDKWSLEHKGSGWYIWRKAYEGERPDLFTDAESLIHRNNMILGSLTALVAAQMPLFITNIHTFTLHIPVSMVLMTAWALLEAVLAGMAIGMALGVSRMKRRVAMMGGKAGRGHGQV